MSFLLDVNVLIALIDETHIYHATAHRWFAKQSSGGWTSCPITENGVIRIVGSPGYGNFPGNPAIAIESLQSLLARPGHVFWADDISLLDSIKVDASRLLTSAQVTDSYLLALARAHGGRLATLDRKLITDAVVGGVESLYVIR